MQITKTSLRLQPRSPLFGEAPAVTAMMTSYDLIIEKGPNKNTPIQIVQNLRTLHHPNNVWLRLRLAKMVDLILKKTDKVTLCNFCNKIFREKCIGEHSFAQMYHPATTDMLRETLLGLLDLVIRKPAELEQIKPTLQQLQEKWTERRPSWSERFSIWYAIYGRIHA